MKKLIFAATLLTGSIASSSLNAAFISFSDRTTWLSSADIMTGSENFNSFVSDVALTSSPTVLSSGMSVSELADGWVIDTTPFSNNFECDINGSSRLCGNNLSTLIFDFSIGISAFGADFSSLNDNSDRTEFDLFSEEGLIGTLSTPQVLGQLDQFFGFIATDGEVITSIRTRQLQSDSFGIDNIEFAAVSVPEPASLALIGLGIIGLVCRRKNNT